MKKLPEVEAAKQLMADAMRWSVMTWLREKKAVRKAADQANAVLDDASETVKQGWPPHMRSAYDALNGGNGARKKSESQSNGNVAVVKCKQAYDEAHRARTAAEETFDRAERLLSTSLAREGCGQAIQSWELKEKAIRLAEEIGKTPSHR